MKNLTKLFLCVAAMFAAFACSSSSPSDVVLTAGNALISGDYEGYVSYVYLGEDKTKLSEEQMIEYRNWLTAALEKSVDRDVKKNGAIRSFEVLGEEINEDGDSASVKTKTTYSKGKEDVKDVDLVLVKGKWYLDL